MSQIHVDILTKARTLLDTGGFIYICNAVLTRDNEYSYRNGYRRDETHQIINWISDSLGLDKRGYRQTTLYNWLRDNRPDLVPGDVNIRFQWIDWMIANHTIFDNYRSTVC
jgi:hypothetical protein